MRIRSTDLSAEEAREAEEEIARRFLGANEATPAWLDAIMEEAATTQRVIAEFLKPYELEWEALQASAKSFTDSLRLGWSAEARDCYPLLARQGWFPYIEIPNEVLVESADLIQKQRFSAADRVLSRYFEDALSEIQTGLLEWYPLRTKPIRAAFWAHRRRRYFLSVPVFLAQADGICVDVLRGSLFRRNRSDRRPQTATAIDATDAFWRTLLAPLATPLPIAATKLERATISVTFNRHVILHGEVCDYGTRLNSLKALSLLGYAGSYLRAWKGLSG